jgi:alpha-D-xyloside xylohydrolase
MHGFKQQDHALVWRGDHETVFIEPWGQDSLRVRATMGARIRDDLPGVLQPPPPSNAQVAIGAEQAMIRNGNIAAEISSAGRIRLLNAETGAALLTEREDTAPWRPPARYFRPVSDDLYRLETYFDAYDDERFYGLGQHQHGKLNQKGCVIDLIQYNTEVSVPFVLSNRGYGFLWHNPAVGRVELGYTHTRWVAEATRQMDYWVTTGDGPAEILAHYADATGHAPMFPEWAAGFWQCKLRYRTQEELLDVAREYKRRGLPLSVIVSDFFNWTMMGEWRFDPEAWPDPTAMVEELEAMGVRLMVSIWPTVNANSENFTEMQQRGLLVRTKRGIPAHMPFHDNWPEGRIYVHYYDATNPEARDYIWEKVKEGYYKHRIKVWWLDACEPEMQPMQPEHVLYHLGDGAAVANIYPLLHEKAFYDGMRAEGEEEIVMLCRSAWAGSQRYGAAVWSGDIPSTFEALRAQVPAGLNMGLSGIPWWNTDIGGFHAGDPDSPYFRELIVRWFQYGLFFALFRLHGVRKGSTGPGSGGPNEIWSFGEEAYGIIKDLLFLRERLRPYIMDQMKLAHEKGVPPMRPLFFDFPEDGDCIDVEDQFMYGPDLLVAPVLYEGARSREVYLPAGTTWRDAWTDERLEGGQWITADAPLDRIPLYLRGDAQLPIRGDI